MCFITRSAGFKTIGYYHLLVVQELTEFRLCIQNLDKVPSYSSKGNYPRFIKISTSVYAFS